MTAAADPTELPPRKKSSKVPLIIGMILAVLGGTGGYFAVRAGLIGGPPSDSEDQADMHAQPENAPIPPAAFIPLDPLIINLPDPTGRRFLRFAAQVEVAPEHLAEVEAIKPRIVDVLNGYLRAVETSDLEDPAALMRLRAQMLRRVQVVAGQGRVRDLLIMEFVLN